MFWREPGFYNKESLLLEPVLTGDASPVVDGGQAAGRGLQVSQSRVRTRSNSSYELCAVTSTYIVSRWPGRRILFVSMPFQRAIWPIDTRKRFAIRYSESPFLTV